MKTINSLSGGKTSSYMAVHYPADYEIFSLVTIDDKTCSPKDKGLTKKVSDKIGKEFIATAESDLTLKVMLDLEQLVGKEIIWLTGESFDNVNKKHGKTVPNMARRYCTTDMKIKPIAEFVYKNVFLKNENCLYNQKVFSNIGIRYDELERAKNGKDRELLTDIVIGKNNERNKWIRKFNWGVANYPLINDKIFHHNIRDFWKSKNLVFPEDSNCVGCFWKDVQQLRKNFDDYPEKMNWFLNQEENSNYNYKSKITYKTIKTIGLQQDFFFGTGSGCQAGFCTD